MIRVPWFPILALLPNVWSVVVASSDSLYVGHRSAKSFPRTLQETPASESIVTLQPGVPHVVLNNATVQSMYILDNVPLGQRVACTLKGDGDVNMVGRYGAPPSGQVYDCIGFIDGTSTEGCGLYATKQPNSSLYIATFANGPYEILALTCSFVDVVKLENDVALSNQASKFFGMTTFYQLETLVSAGDNVSCSLLGDNGNADLYLRYGRDPEIFERTGRGSDCRSRAVNSSIEHCVLAAPTQDTELYLAIDTMEPYDNLTVKCVSPIPSASTQSDEEGLGCFSQDTTVMVLGKGRVTMSQLQLGDAVLVASSNGPRYESVYAFGHYHETVQLEYLQFTFQEEDTQQQPLEVTANHLLFVQGRSNHLPVRADTVQVGDVLISGDANLQERYRVTKMETVTRHGAYLPLTRSGTLIVNDAVVASTYVSIATAAPGMMQPFLALVSEQWIFHTWLTPLRLTCQPYFGSSTPTNSSWCQITPTTTDDDNEDGILKWLQVGLALARFGERQVWPVQLVGFLLALVILMSFAMVESMVASAGTGLVVLATMAMVYFAWEWKQSRRAKKDRTASSKKLVMYNEC